MNFVGVKNRYLFIIKLKAIKYKKDMPYYLSLNINFLALRFLTFASKLLLNLYLYYYYLLLFMLLKFTYSLK